MNSEQARFIKAKWNISKAIWGRTFEQNVKILCDVYKDKVREGWRPIDILEDFHCMIIESLNEMNGEAEEEKLEEDNFMILVIKDTIKNTISVGTREKITQAEALDTMLKQLINAYDEMELEISQESRGKKMWKKLKNWIKWHYYKWFIYKDK